MVVEGDEGMCSTLVDLAARGERLNSVRIDDHSFALTFEHGSEFSGEILEYYFGELNVPDCVPKDRFPEGERCALIRLQLEPERATDELGPAVRSSIQHRSPEPHFLDLDWRFTRRTARWISETARASADGGMICYLGCPTLALWHSIWWPDERNWLLLDRGHFALERWKEDYIPDDRHRAYDVFSEPEAGDQSRYAVVVADPPWYLREYRAFCRRARQFAAGDALVLLSSYPPSPPYKPEKHEQLKATIAAEFGHPCWHGSFEIDYEIPPFEKSWSKHQDFEHTALGVYRPGYMDAYRIREEGRHGSDDLGTPDTRVLPNVLEIGDGQYLRWVGANGLPCMATVERRRELRRMRSAGYENVLAWSTRNAIVRRSDAGTQVDTHEALVNLVVEWERNQ